ncbi:M23 family metallopeptidase [Maribacter sp. 2304DJ31-5]|uniref:M23 family metallopeptidase n=1 Tax=Maribacter sp. 2304DJ31-5 TaxID=3386273 RepID=UPI0039BCA030
MLWHCDTDDAFVENERSNIKTVSEQEPLQYLTGKIAGNSLKGLSGKNGTTLKADAIAYERIGNSTESLLVMDIDDPIRKHLQSRILMLKINDSIQSVKLHMTANESSNEASYTGILYIFNLEDEFLFGYKVQEGKTVSKLIRKQNNETEGATAKNQDQTGKSGFYLYFNCICTGDYIVVPDWRAYVTFRSYKMVNGTRCHTITNTLAEVTVTAPRSDNNINISDIFINPYRNPRYGLGNTNPATLPYWEYGGGGNQDQDQKPCKGDPVKNPEIAPQTNSGIKGGMHDTCARRNDAYTCKGIRGRKWHNGVDIKNPYGAPIYAIYDGVATIHKQTNKKTGKLVGAGYYSAIKSTVNGKTVRMVFFHLQKDKRATGTVKAGDIIGYQGDSGNLKNGIKQGYAVSHVHVKAQENGANVDPLNHFKTKIDPTTGQVTNPCN